MGNCNHRKYMPHLVEPVSTGAVVPSALTSQVENVEDAVEAYRAFDQLDSGWMKVEFAPLASDAATQGPRQQQGDESI